MDEDEPDESLTTVGGDFEVEIKEMMGLYDVPPSPGEARSSRRHSDRLRERCRQARLPIGSTWSMCGSDSGLASRDRPGVRTAVFSSVHRAALAALRAEPPRWAAEPAPLRRQLEIARDLIAAVVRFNQRWVQFLEGFEIRSGQLGHRRLQSLLSPGEGVRDGLRPARRPVLHARAQAFPRTCSFATIRFCPCPALTRAFTGRLLGCL